MSGDKRKAVVHEKQRVFDGFFKIDRAVVSFTDEQGTIENAKIEVFERGDSAAAILHNPTTRQIIFTEQFRFPTYEKGPGWMREIIAGSIENGETAEDCIRREISEEIGYAVAAVEFISRFYVSPGGTSERIWVFYCAVTDDDLKDPAARGLAGHSEQVARLSCSEDEFFAAIDKGDIQDAKSIIAGQWLKLKLQR